VVGDVARYWLTVLGGTRDNDPPNEMINLNLPPIPAGGAAPPPVGLQDAPGVHLQQYPTLNFGAGTVNTALSVPDVFYLANGALGFNGIAPQGCIPASAQLERSQGVYVAFARPAPAGTSHTVTAQTNAPGTAPGTTPQQSLSGFGNSQLAQAGGKSTISFSRAVADVTVDLAAQPAAEAATMPMVPFQRAAISVAPDTARTYRVTVAEPGFIASVTGTGLELTAVGVDPATHAGVPGGATDDVEISRFYPLDAAGSGATGIGPMHLASDVHIAVRRFRIQLVNTIPLRASLSLDPAAVITAVTANLTTFLLVPARLAAITPSAITVTVTGTPSPLDPPRTPAAGVPADVTTFVADGAALQVEFLADQPPERQATVRFTVRVGVDATNNVPLTCEVTIDPHFTLDMVGGGLFQVTRGGAPVVLQSSDGTVIQPTSPAPAGVTFTPSNAQLTVSVDASFGPNSLTIQVRDNAAVNRQARRTLTVA
jgi:hypothetical protein